MLTDEETKKFVYKAYLTLNSLPLAIRMSLYPGAGRVPFAWDTHFLLSERKSQSVLFVLALLK